MLAAFLAATAPVAVFAQPAKAGAESLQTEEQKTFYALGLWLSQQVDVFDLSAADLKYVQLGLRDAVLKQTPKVDARVYGQKLNDIAQARLKRKSDQEKVKAGGFLAKAAKEPGAQAFLSGLIYKELKAGTGASPKAEDTIKAHYHGTLADGTVFDSSVQRGEPLEFSLAGVIKCWQEGIPKMKVGGKAKLVCPADIAYGDRGSGKIPPGAALTFEVELLGIVKK
ncbi:MAG: FKBP-type peptidyl-prolyl cis-trans isomerase [Elusimicrobia bacterium]|nr:FKBP-type peptidyl-prolyl cis-trans isomerase [Elusimicrobiota bacterium]